MHSCQIKVGPRNQREKTGLWVVMCQGEEEVKMILGWGWEMIRLKMFTTVSRDLPGTSCVITCRESNHHGRTDGSDELTCRGFYLWAKHLPSIIAFNPGSHPL